MATENFNNKCDGCGIELTNTYSYSDGNLYSKNHNFFQTFLITKGKKKHDNENFQFCDQCEKEFRDYLIQEAIKELKSKNIAYSELLTHRWFSDRFTEEGYQKYQNTLAENIKRHSREWQIKEVNYQPYEQKKPSPPDYQMPLMPKQIEKKTILYHQSFELEYDQNGSLTLENSWDPRRIYFETDFLPEKWNEIKKSLNVERTIWATEAKKQEEIPTFKKAALKILAILGITALITQVAILLFKSLRRVKN